MNSRAALELFLPPVKILRISFWEDARPKPFTLFSPYAKAPTEQMVSQRHPAISTIVFLSKWKE